MKGEAMTSNCTYRKINLAEAEEREQLLFHRPYEPGKYRMGGCCSFDELSVADAKELMHRGFIDPEDTQNSSPTMQEFLDFCDDGTGIWTLHGYAVSPDRTDCRITFEGVRSSGPLSAEQTVDFLMTFRDADELYGGVNETAYCWYD